MNKFTFNTERQAVKLEITPENLKEDDEPYAVVGGAFSELPDHS